MYFAASFPSRLLSGPIVEMPKRALVPETPPPVKRTAISLHSPYPCPPGWTSIPSSTLPSLPARETFRSKLIALRASRFSSSPSSSPQPSKPSTRSSPQPDTQAEIFSSLSPSSQLADALSEISADLAASNRPYGALVASRGAKLAKQKRDSEIDAGLWQMVVAKERKTQENVKEKRI